MEWLQAIGEFGYDNVMICAKSPHVFDEGSVQERHIARGGESVVMRGIEKAGVDASQRTLALYDVGGDGAIEIEIIKRFVGDKDHFCKYFSENSHGSVNEPLAADM